MTALPIIVEWQLVADCGRRTAGRVKAAPALVDHAPA